MTALRFLGQLDMAPVPWILDWLYCCYNPSLAFYRGDAMADSRNSPNQFDLI
jgi:hypothetical protein